jgi:DNA repair protein RadB
MRISSGNKDLDEWLNGGYENDIITVLYGPAGSGKTNLCVLAAVEQAKQGKKVIFIDTEGGFSTERIRQIDESAGKNIFLLKAVKFYEQSQLINRLLAQITKNVSLIIVDGIAMLYRLEASIAREKGGDKIRIINMTLAKQLRILSEIARKKNIPVIVTDQVYSDFIRSDELKSLEEKKVYMVGGDLMKYWAKCIIELQKQREGKRKAILRKHRSLPEKEFSFIINNKGIEKAGFKLF